MKRSLLFLTVSALLCGSLSAATIVYTTNLLGSNENLPTGSPGTGSVRVTYDSIAQTLEIDIDFSGLGSPTTVAHIHCCVDPPGNVGVAVTPGTLPGFPVGVTAGSYLATVDLTLVPTYTAGFLAGFGGGTISGAEAALFDGMNAGRAYVNIHTTTFQGGEIRGFLQPIPEPSTWALIAVPLAAFALARRRHIRN